MGFNKGDGFNSTCLVQTSGDVRIIQAFKRFREAQSQETLRSGRGIVGALKGQHLSAMGVAHRKRTTNITSPERAQ
jgi:hypothetical protein